jgi:hypothetical protein
MHATVLGTGRNLTFTSTFVKFKYMFIVSFKRFMTNVEDSTKDQFL